VDAVRGLCIGHHAFPLALDAAVVFVSAVVMGALATRAFAGMEV
jgi:hypothetical protein